MCSITASYGYLHTKPILCNKHKSPNMLNLRIKKCEHEKCISRAYYGYTTPILCKLHKRDTIRIKKTCIYANCNIQANFGHEKALYCRTHSSETMKT